LTFRPFSNCLPTKRAAHFAEIGQNPSDRHPTSAYKPGMVCFNITNINLDFSPDATKKNRKETVHSRRSLSLHSAIGSAAIMRVSHIFWAFSRTKQTIYMHFNGTLYLLKQYIYVKKNKRVLKHQFLAQIEPFNPALATYDHRGRH